VLAGSLLEVAALTAMVAAVLACSRSKAHELLAFATFGAVVLVFSLSTRGVVSAVLSKAFPVWIGTLSYSIYMIHAMVFNIMLNVWEYVLKLPVGRPASETVGKIVVTDHAVLINALGIAAVVLLARCTYTWVERPWRDRFRGWASTFRTPVVERAAPIVPTAPLL
jgi:peptidoglycan/LPS O-acetylase OafA/YrhL